MILVAPPPVGAAVAGPASRSRSSPGSGWPQSGWPIPTAARPGTVSSRLIRRRNHTER